jgi:competence protein ComFB
MNVHNIMEEQVTARINNLYDQLKVENPVWFTCDCQSCRLDAISYVLNRISPKYVVSGRGITHTQDILEDTQLKADIDALGMEGIRLVNASKRPYHNKLHHRLPLEIASPLFNFPIFSGTVYDGSTFEPLTGASIKLLQNGKKSGMVDSSWYNPCKTYKTTKGNYTFWVKPEPAEKEQVSKQFHFTLEITAPDYDPVSHVFDVTLVSEKLDKSQTDSVYTLQIQDLFLFRKGTENPME